MAYLPDANVFIQANDAVGPSDYLLVLARPGTRRVAVCASAG